MNGITIVHFTESDGNVLFQAFVTQEVASPCDEQTQFHCHIAKTDELRSHDPICIPRVEVCDGRPNCPNGDDEAAGPRTGCESLNCAIRNGGCSQLCTVIGDRVKCDCHPGYIRSPDNPRVCIAIGEIRILYVNNGQLYGRDLKGASPSRMLQIKINPHNLTEQIRWTHTHSSHSRLNSVDRMLWSEMGDFDYSLKPSSDGSTQLSVIFAHNSEWSGLFGISARSNAESKSGSGMLALNSLWTLFVHGSNASPRIITHSFTIAFDWVHDLVYWTNGALRTIGVIDRKRGWRKTLAELPASSQPLGIVVDPRFGRLYWVNRGRTMAIEVMDMDGQNRRPLVTGNLVSPGSLSLDYERNELYWTDGRRGVVEAYDLRKRERRMVIQSNKYYPAWVAVFEDWVYWTDRKVKSLMRANKFTDEAFRQLRINTASADGDIEEKRAPSSALIVLIVVFASCSLGLSMACLGHYTYHKYVQGSVMERVVNGSMGSVELNRKTNSVDLLDVPEQDMLSQTNCNA
ncbi:uncharacterized protein DEA37_0008695 [Paragonimus westermani]|uniref:EGF-like domain-containing protein n=1 Tax=Paragonimus westermani TaxID=34504 RepID=A0A5J4NSD8_9TREM|nr:uncharacterized protein DEA37_0008695 [Paragonimus westermani]